MSAPLLEKTDTNGPFPQYKEIHHSYYHVSVKIPWILGLYAAAGIKSDYRFHDRQHLARENLADSDPVIIPYKVL